jgi:hypothetical protein
MINIHARVIASSFGILALVAGCGAPAPGGEEATSTDTPAGGHADEAKAGATTEAADVDAVERVAPGRAVGVTIEEEQPLSDGETDLVVREAAAAGYGVAQLRADLAAALKPYHDPSVGWLGRDGIMSKWTTAKVTELLYGIQNVKNIFYPEFALRDVARLIVCEGAQESTGDYNLGVHSIDFNDHGAQGFIQVTPGSVVKDYHDFGTKIVNAAGHVVLDPAKSKSYNLSNVRTNVAFWAWYTHNTVAAGVSLNEWVHRNEWHIQVGGVTPDYGNSMYDWLAGPRHDRHKDDSAFRDYYGRIRAYWNHAGFGSSFDALLAKRFSTRIIDVK